MTATRITVLISGNGTNLQALIDHIASGKLSATIVRVVSNRKNAYGLQRAEQAGIPTSYHNLLKYKKEHPSTEEGVRAAREKYDEDLAGIVLQDKPNLIACLGFMHVVSTKFLDPIYEVGIKIINLHPALPGQFDGADAIERAHTAWMDGKIDKTGVMIHKVIPEVDQGTPIVVREIPFIKGVDEDIKVFEARLHEIEWGVVIQGIEKAIQEPKDLTSEP